MCYSQVDLTLCVMDWEGQNERKVRGEALMEREDPGMLWKWYSWLLLYLVRGWGGNSRQVWWWWLFIWLWWFISPNLDCQCSEIKEYKFSLYLAKIELVHSRKIFKSSGFYSFFFFFFGPHRTACGILVPHQGSNTCPLQWKSGVLTAGPPGKSPVAFTLDESHLYIHL